MNIRPRSHILPWLIVLILAVAATYAMFRRTEPAPAASPPAGATASATGPGGGAVQIGVIPAVEGLEGAMKIRNELQQALKSGRARLAELKAEYDKLTEIQQGMIRSVADAYVDDFKEPLERALALPGAGDKLKPVWEEFNGKLAALTSPPKG
jgi:hypothetical protein